MKFLFLFIVLVVFIVLIICYKSKQELFNVNINYPSDKVKHINFENITLEEFNKLIYEKTPIVFHNVLKNKLTLDEFCNKLGDKVINVRTGNYKTSEGRKENKLNSLNHEEKIKDYCNKFINNKFQGYGGNNKITAEEINKLKLIPNNDFIKKFPGGKLWIGKKNSKTPLHKDKPKNLSLQIIGSKKWVIFDSKDKKNLCYDDTNDALEWSNYVLNDYNTCKNAKKTNEIILILNEGDMLYLPEQWSHDVTNIKDSVMINFWYLNQSLWERFNL